MSGESERYAEIHLRRYGESPLDLSVQIASSPDDVFRSPTEFRDACAAPALITRANVSVCVHAPRPGGVDSEDIPMEIALVRDVLDHLADYALDYSAD